MKKHIIIVGGDQRQLHLANLLSNENFEVTCTLFDKTINSETIKIDNNYKSILNTADIIVFPMPMCKDGFHLNTPLYSQDDILLLDCMNHAKKDAILFGGKVDDKNLPIIDYLEREEFAVLNAVASAEGSIEIAMRETQHTISNSNCLILGYGRIAKCILKILCAMGANTTVIARKKSDLAWAQINGAKAFDFSFKEQLLKDADIIFNTIPKLVLDDKALSKIAPKKLIIDVSSKPGGAGLKGKILQTKKQEKNCNIINFVVLLIKEYMIKRKVLLE